MYKPSLTMDKWREAYKIVPGLKKGINSLNKCIPINGV